MTRETKIGLLVGLAFIIVIGVLLSDHIQSSTEPRRAELTASSEVLRRGIDVPGGTGVAPTQVVPPSVVQPVTTVVTTDYLTQAPRPEADIRIGPGTTPAVQTPSERIVAVTQLETGPRVQLPPTNPVPMLADGPSTQTQVVTREATSAQPPTGVVVTPDPERQIADVLGARQASSVTPGPAATNSPAGVRTHVAVEGDSVYRMTIKYYGAYSKSREALIVKANPSMGGRADKITIGQTYTIPPLPGSTVDTSSAVADRAQQARDTIPPATPVSPTPSVREAAPAPAPVVRQSTYTVRDGDSLWRIADRTGSSIAEIKALNKDLLRGSDALRPGMTLRIPTRSASAAVN